MRDLPTNAMETSVVAALRRAPLRLALRVHCPSCTVPDADEILILRTTLEDSGIGDFSSRQQIGEKLGTGAYRIGKTGAELRDLGYSKLKAGVACNGKTTR